MRQENGRAFTPPESMHIKEAREEVGLDVGNLELLTVAQSGATVQWDLYYFLAHDYIERPDGQELEPGENIEILWMNPSEVLQAVADGEMQEWQSIGVLLGRVFQNKAYSANGKP